MNEISKPDPENEFRDAYNVASSLFELLSCDPDDSLEPGTLVKVGNAGYKAMEEAKAAFYRALEQVPVGGQS